MAGILELFCAARDTIVDVCRLFVRVNLIACRTALLATPTTIGFETSFATSRIQTWR
jgi:hypothetical protein